MDAVTLINQNLDIDRLLEYYRFENIKADSDIIRCSCKIHGGSNPTSFAINRENGRWYCHTKCGGGDAYTLVQRMEKVGWEESILWLSSFFGISIDGLQIKQQKIMYLEDSKKFIKTMMNHKTSVQVPFFIDVEIREVRKYRKFKEETLIHFGLGWVKSVSLEKRIGGETYTLYNRLCFPIIFKGIQVGISFRSLSTSDYPRWSHQPAHFITGDILYNYDACTSENVVVVVEGISDVWAFHEIGITAVCTFGAHITHQQYKLLLKIGADIAFAFDGDDAGRQITTKIIKLFSNKANISVIHFNEGEDPESIEREELRERFNSRKKH